MTLLQREGRHLGPRVNPAVKKRALRLKWENPKWGATRIGKILKEEYPDVRLPSDRQMYRWIKDLPAVTDEDRPWRFSQNDRADLPWEATPLLLRLARSHATQLTNCVARWCWRVHIGAPDLSDGDTFGLGKEYADRDWLGRILKTEPYFDDLDGVLTYQPWKSQESYTQYVQAIKGSVIAGDLGPGAFKDDKEEEAFRLAQEKGMLPTTPPMWRFLRSDRWGSRQRV